MIWVVMVSAWFFSLLAFAQGSSCRSLSDSAALPSQGSSDSPNPLFALIARINISLVGSCMPHMVCEANPALSWAASIRNCDRSCASPNAKVTRCLVVHYVLFLHIFLNVNLGFLVLGVEGNHFHTPERQNKTRIFHRRKCNSIRVQIAAILLPLSQKRFLTKRIIAEKYGFEESSVPP